MPNRLLKMIVKNNEQADSLAVRTRCGFVSSVAGIVSNTLLCVFKFLVGYFSGSAAVISDAANNLSDVSTFVISFVGFRIAAKPADEEHPYGHGRVEYILSLIISFFVLLMGAELLKNAVGKILHPSELHYSFVFIVILIASIVIKVLLGVLNLRLHKAVHMPALKAVARDSLSDCVCTLSVLLSLFVFHRFQINIDGYIGAAVAVPVLYSGIQLLKESVQPLIGKPAQKETAQALAARITAFDSRILGVHDIMLHDYGMGRVFAVAHAEVPAECSLKEIHDVIDCIEKDVEQSLAIHLVLHIDPVDVHNARALQLQAKVASIVKSVDEHYTIHDFRLSQDGKQMFFDLVIDEDIKKDTQKIADMVAKRIAAVQGDTPEAVIRVEFPFTQPWA